MLVRSISSGLLCDIYSLEYQLLLLLFPAVCSNASPKVLGWTFFIDTYCTPKLFTTQWWIVYLFRVACWPCCFLLQTTITKEDLCDHVWEFRFKTVSTRLCCGYSMVLVVYKSEKHFHLCAASSIPFVLTLKAANSWTHCDQRKCGHKCVCWPTKQLQPEESIVFWYFFPCTISISTCFISDQSMLSQQAAPQYWDRKSVV